MSFIILNLLFSLSIKIALCIHFHFNAMHLPKYIGTHFFGNNSHTKTWYLLLCASSLCSFAIFCSLLSILLLIGQRKHLNYNQIVGKNMYIYLVNVDNLRFTYYEQHFLIEMIVKKFFYLKDRRWSRMTFLSSICWSHEVDFGKIIILWVWHIKENPIRLLLMGPSLPCSEKWLLFST